MSGRGVGTDPQQQKIPQDFPQPLGQQSLRLHTAFNPSKHGFLFANHFELSLPLLPNRARFTIGLCGGMCSLALEAYCCKRLLTRQTQPPAPGSSLYRLLWRRQLSSLLPITRPLKILYQTWQGDERLWRQSLREARRLWDLINHAGPQVLILIRTRGLANPFQNHQALATGIEWRNSNREWIIYLYDPNYPGQELTLRLSTDESQPRPRIEYSSGEQTRGFFVQRHCPCRRPKGEPLVTAS